MTTRLSTLGNLCFALVSLVMLRGEGCGESALPPPRPAGGAPTGSVLDCDAGMLELPMIPGQKIDLPDCGVGAGFLADAETALPPWLTIVRDPETGRAQLRAGLEAPMGGPVDATLILKPAGAGDPKRLRVRVTVAVMSAALSLGSEALGGRVEREWSPRAPARYVVTADAPFDLIVDALSLHGLDVISWTVSSVADPLDLRLYDGNLHRYFELPEGAWDIAAEVRDQLRNTVTVSARVYAIAPDTLGIMTLERVEACPAELSELEGMLGGPCSAADTSAVPVCVEATLVDGAEPLEIVGSFARTVEPDRPRTSASPSSDGHADRFAFCAGVGETITVHVEIDARRAAAALGTIRAPELVIAR